MQNFKRASIYITLIGCISLFSCKKDWLEAKSDIQLTVPSTIKDLQLLLDNDMFNFNAVGFGEISCDDYFLQDAQYNSILQDDARKAYIWNSTFFDNASIDAVDWNTPYTSVYYANTILETIAKLRPEDADPAQKNNVIGSAYFFRAYALYEIASLFAAPFNEASADQSLGVPLRTSSDFNVTYPRSSVRETYEFITNDLKNSISLLPLKPAYKSRPSKAASYAMLARVYLSMRKYDLANLYSDSAIKSYSDTLLNYNRVNLNPPFPFAPYNSESIFYKVLANHPPYLFVYHTIDAAVFNSYDNNDLRKTGFFRLLGPRRIFKGSYAGGLPMFGGLALDEMYLIRAETNARLNKLPEALADLNYLMQRRWNENVSYPAITAPTPDEALDKILAERRKELLFRGTRWTDLRRLNQEDKYKVTLTRTINNQTYTLPPNDLRYVLPIPANVIKLSGIQQNPR